MPAGAASTTRSTAPTSSPTTAVPAAQAPSTRCAAPQVIATRQRPSSTRPRRSPRAATSMPSATAVNAGQLWSRSAGRQRTPACATPASSPATAATPAAPSSLLLVQPRPAHRDPDRPRPPDRHELQPRRRRATCCWSRPSPPSRTARTRSPRSMPRTRSSVYRNWLGLMKGDLDRQLRARAARRWTARLNPDRTYTAPDGGTLTLPGRSLMLVRNVGHLMTTDAVLDADGTEVPEGMLDGLVTSLCALHDLQGHWAPTATPAAGSVYIVKPKMHGPEEVAFTVRPVRPRRGRPGPARATRSRSASWTRSGAPRVNLKECIRVATRAGDLHQHRLPRPHRRRDPHRHGGRPGAAQGRHEDRRPGSWPTRTGTWTSASPAACSGHAQIGKGMWTMPDEMRAMVATKAGHPKAGANCAWVPSPTAATLHAMHYHQVDVAARQAELAPRGRRASLDDHPASPARRRGRNWTAGGDPAGARQQLPGPSSAMWCAGSTRAWAAPRCPDIDQRRPDGGPRDAAHLQPASSPTGCITASSAATQVMETLQAHGRGGGPPECRRSPLHQPMAPALHGIAFQAACDLIFKGREVPNGYTEPTLHRRRREFKAALRGD